MKQCYFKLRCLTAAIFLLSAISLGAQEVGVTKQKEQSKDTLALTLDEAVKIAMSENISIKIADREIIKKGYAKKGTYASLFPQINFSANYQRTIAMQVMYMGEQEIKFGRDNSWSTGFNASMPIISVPLWKSIQISAKDVELAIEKAKGSKMDMIEQVKQAFYASLLAMDSYYVYKENYDNACRNYKVVKDKYDNGKTSQYDLIRAEVTMQNAEPNMYNAQNYIVVTQWQLKALLGVDLELNIKCVGSLADYNEQLERAENYLETNLDNNSSLKQLAIQEDILAKSYQAKLANYYPSLNFSISYQWSTMTDNFKFSTFRWNPYSVGGLSLSIPIFSGGQRYNALKQTRVEQQQLNLQMEDTRRNLEVAIKQSLSSLETCVKQYIAAQKSIEGAEKGNVISQKRYEIGSGTLLEMQDSQLALLQARLNLNNSIYNYLVAKSSLDKILGANLNYVEKVNNSKE